MDIDYRLWLQELDRIEQDNQAEIWGVETETIWEGEQPTIPSPLYDSPLYDDEF